MKCHFIRHRHINSHSGQTCMLAKTSKATPVLLCVAQMEAAPPTPAHELITALIVLGRSARFAGTPGGGDDMAET